MNIYQKAVQVKLRFSTNKGVLSVEQLFDLPLTNIASLIKEQSKVLSSQGLADDLNFLLEESKVNPEDELKFNILKDVYLTKKSEMDSTKQAAAIKEHNRKIDELIYQKQEASLKELSVDDLMKLRK
jgi:hypothetical protein